MYRKMSANLVVTARSGGDGLSEEPFILKFGRKAVTIHNEIYAMTMKLNLFFRSGLSENAVCCLLEQVLSCD